MKNLTHVALPIVLAGMLTGCMIHETPYAYGTPATQSASGYPLYYADGVYWAYQYDTWYWWSNDHWLVSGYAPHGAVLVSAPHYSGGHVGTTHHGAVHSSSHGSSHGGSHGHGHH